MINNTLYLYCFLAGLLGILFHIFAIKIPAVKARATTANITFKMGDYFRDDYPAIMASVITVIILVGVLDEIIGYNPSFLRYIKFFFVFIGYTGSSILIGVLGKFDTAIQNVIDIKTDISDGKIDPKL